MKRLFWLVPALLLAGCGAPAPLSVSPGPTPSPYSTQPARVTPRIAWVTPVITPEPTPIALDPARQDFYSRALIRPDEALYRLLFTAAEARQTQVDVSALAPDAVAVARARIAVMRHPEFYGLTNMTLAGGVVTLSYVGAAPEAWQAQIEAFRERAQEILSQARPGASQTEQALAVYQALAREVRYVPGGATDACGALLSGQAMAPGFALALDYLLDQLGIECHVTYAADGSHLWNTALLDGQYYHLDAAYDAASGGGQALAFFAMGDNARRAGSVYTQWRSGDAGVFSYDTPACTDGRYAYLSSALSAAVDWDRRVLYWVDGDLTIHGRRLTDGARFEPNCPPALSIAWQDGLLCYLDAADYRTYCLDTGTGAIAASTEIALAPRNRSD